MQRAHNQVISPADMAKVILEELQGFNPLNSLKHSFWYLAGIIVLVIVCFCMFSVGYRAVQRHLLRLNVGLHQEHLGNKTGADVGN
jgi:hypothetical protein